MILVLCLEFFAQGNAEGLYKGGGRSSRKGVLQKRLVFKSIQFMSHLFARIMAQCIAALLYYLSSGRLQEIPVDNKQKNIIGQTPDNPQ